MLEVVADHDADRVEYLLVREGLRHSVHQLITVHVFDAMLIERERGMGHRLVHSARDASGLVYYTVNTVHLRNVLDCTIQCIRPCGVEHRICWNFSYGIRHCYDGADVGCNLRVLATNNYEVFTFDSVITFDARGELKFFV